MAKNIFKPMPPVGRIEIEGPFNKRREQRANDANFLRHLAVHLEENFGMTVFTCNYLSEIAVRLDKK